MEAIGLGAQDGAEGPASAFVHPPHGLGKLPRIPALEHGHLAAICQSKRRYVDGAAFAVLGQFCTFLVIARAAGIMRGHTNAAQAAALFRERGLG